MLLKLGNDRLSDFLSFCQAHRGSIDESCLYDEDLRKFVPDGENPTYLALAPDQTIIGAASVLNSAYYRRGRKGRFRIFHVIPPGDPGLYGQLLSAIVPDVPALNELYLFVPVDNQRLRDLLESLHFDVERYAYFMARDASPAAPPEWEEDYVFRPLVFDQDEADYCYVRNLSFAGLMGSQTPLMRDEVSRLKDRDDYLGMFLLYHREQPVGVVRVTKDVYGGGAVMNIGPLALVPDYQGKGLGRQLLRAALEIGRSLGFPKSVLSANVDNENAVRLYTSEGFSTVEAVACYTYIIPK
jgi:mycothiol synthase